MSSGVCAPKPREARRPGFCGDRSQPLDARGLLLQLKQTPMKKTLLLIALTGAFSLATSLHAQSRQLVKKWETEATLKTPESVLYDAGGRVLYVSNIDGKE